MYYNQVHKELAFRWVGRHIEFPNEQPSSNWAVPKRIPTSKSLTDEDREKYLVCLRETLNPKRGLWLTKPKNDFIGTEKNRVVSLDEPCICFTELAPEDSCGHAMLYGRMAFGVSKRFILNSGGHPVHYVLGTGNDPNTKMVKSLLDRLQGEEFQTARETFFHLCQFLKRVSHPRVQPTRRRKRVAKYRPPEEEDAYRAKLGKPLHFLEEREWRILYNSGLKGFKPGNGDGKPELCLPVRPGRDLFAVILPDDATVHMAMKDPFIRTKLFAANQPAVLVSSLERIKLNS
jgi:hypothetical protein